MPSPLDPADHDPELSRFLEAVIDLSAERHVRGPDDFLANLEGLGQRFASLRRYRSDQVLRQRLAAFARRRFDLVDDPSEYALAWDEVAVLTMALAEAAPLAFDALKAALERLASNLTREGVPALFGKGLSRVRQLAKRHADAELEAWVQGVVNALPDA